MATQKGTKSKTEKKRTLSRKRQAKMIVEFLENRGSLADAMRKAGYSESYIKSGTLKKTKTWRELLEEFLPDDFILKKLKWLLNEKKDKRVVAKAIEIALKTKGRFIDKMELGRPGEFTELSDAELFQVLREFINAYKRYRDAR